MSSKPYCCKHDASVTDCDCPCHDHKACEEHIAQLESSLEQCVKDIGALKKELSQRKSWQHCELHGKINADHAWGCPDCVDELRKENRKLQAEYDQEVISHDIEEKDLKAQIGNEGEKANENGGTLNPALLNIGTKGDS